MSSIATCPQCAAQLALPEAASESDYAQCPECRAEFSLAEAEHRTLAAAQLIVKLPEPEPVAEPEIHPEPITYPEASAADETMILPDPVELPLEHEFVSKETPETPQPVSLDDLTPAASSAETVVADSEELVGWEERIRSAIDSNAEENSMANADIDSNALSPEKSLEENPEEPFEAAVAGLGSTSLEDSPQFDFQMDPPDETPIEHESATPEELTKTAEWFESTSTENVAELEVPPTAASSIPALETTIPAAVAQTGNDLASEEEKPVHTKLRRKTNSLARLSGVFLLFALIGTTLGQYALLWLRGPSADYLGLAQVLPSSALPPPTSQLLAPQISGGEQLAATEPAIETDDPTAQTQLAESTPEAESPIADLLKDDAVIPAAAELPIEPKQQSPPLLPATGTTAAEFSALLNEAQQAVPGFLAGEVTSPETKRTKGQAYMAFCRLAERWDFAGVDSANLDDAAAKTLFENIAGQSAGRDALAFIGQRWWQHNGRPHQGCVLVGRVVGANTLGKGGEVTLYELALENSDAEIVVPFFAKDGDIQRGTTIAVVGTIVQDPDRVVPGYSGFLPQAVVARFYFGL